MGPKTAGGCMLFRARSLAFFPHMHTYLTTGLTQSSGCTTAQPSVNHHHRVKSRHTIKHVELRDCLVATPQRPPFPTSLSSYRQTVLCWHHQHHQQRRAAARSQARRDVCIVLISDFSDFFFCFGFGIHCHAKVWCCSKMANTIARSMAQHEHYHHRRERLDLCIILSQYIVEVLNRKDFNKFQLVGRLHSRLNFFAFLCAE